MKKIYLNLLITALLPFLANASNLPNNTHMNNKIDVSSLYSKNPIEPLQQWQTLPPTPHLPHSTHSGYAPINGIKVWYATFGEGSPVILLHGGLANSNYWGDLVPVLEKHYRVIVMDSRGHGRSTLNDQPISYHLMATDVLALMDFLKIQKATIVGWSDGANIGLDIAISHPDRLQKLFSFAANSSPDATMDIEKSPVFNAYSERTEKEYMAISPTPTLSSYKAFNQQISKMWASEPNFTKTKLQGIQVPVWIVDGDRDEAVKRSDTEYMASTIPNAGLLIEPNVSHFAFLQDPQQFNADVLHFLTHVKDKE